MRELARTLLPCALVAVLVVGLAGGVAAGGTDKKVEKFCKAASDVDAQLGNTPGLSTDEVADYAADARKSLKRLAKIAPEKDLKQALKTLAKYYGGIAASGDLESANYNDEQVAAVETITTYATNTCAPLLTTAST